MYLIVRLSQSPESEGRLEVLEFHDAAAARQALDTLHDGTSETVSLRNDEGTLLCLRRTAIRSARLAEAMPDMVDAGLRGALVVDKGRLLERLGDPLYEGPGGSVYAQIRDQVARSAPARDRLMIWGCAEGEQPCIARNDGITEDWFFVPCAAHRERFAQE